MSQLIECVPNFSEGNDMNIIKQITNEIESVDGVKLLNVGGLRARGLSGRDVGHAGGRNRPRGTATADFHSRSLSRRAPRCGALGYLQIRTLVPLRPLTARPRKSLAPDGCSGTVAGTTRGRASTWRYPSPAGLWLQPRRRSAAVPSR